MKNNQKGFANIVLIVVMLLIVGGVSYFAWEKNHTANVQENTNNTLAIKIGRVAIDLKLAQEEQSAIKEGHQPWRADSLAVAELAIYGNAFAVPENDKSIETISLNYTKGVAVYVLSLDGKKYEVTLTQPIVVGEGNIWEVSDIEYASDTPTVKTHTPDTISKVPHIDKIVPASWAYPADGGFGNQAPKITLTGSGFLPLVTKPCGGGTCIISGGNKIKYDGQVLDLPTNIDSSADGKTLTFQLASYFTSDGGKSFSITVGKHQIAVVNDNGTSNVVVFEVTK